MSCVISRYIIKINIVDLTPILQSPKTFIEIVEYFICVKLFFF